MVARAFWERNEPWYAGRVIFRYLIADEQVKWAADVLRFATELTGRTNWQIEQVLAVCHDKARWTEAKSCFGDVRDVTLRQDTWIGIKQRFLSERWLRGDNVFLCVLVLAEMAAKVTYNRTNPDDEFDEAAGPRIVVIAHELGRLVDRNEALERAWQGVARIPAHAGSKP